MADENKLTGMESARRHIGAFLVSGAVAGLPAGVVAASLVPNDWSVVLGVVLGVGIFAGLAAASIPPIRNWIGRAINFFNQW